MKFWWPVFLIAACSVAYQLGIKEISGGMHPLSALTVTYLSASLTSYMLYVLLAPKGENRKKEIFSWNCRIMGSRNSAPLTSS